MRDRNPCKNARNQADIRRSGTLDAGDDVLARLIELWPIIASDAQNELLSSAERLAATVGKNVFVQ